MARRAAEIVAISGGTGSAKFLRGLQRLGSFTVVANVADNAWFHGLYVCPDVDIVTYTLAAMADTRRGWGIRGTVRQPLSQLKRLGAERHLVQHRRHGHGHRRVQDGSDEGRPGSRR